MANPKCPTCGGVMWSDYQSSQFGKDYYWKCSKKKIHNYSCPDTKRYYECDKHEKINCEICTKLQEPTDGK